MLVTPTRLFTPFASLSGAAESSVEGWSLYFHSPRKRVSLGLLSAVRFETGVFTSTACTLCGRAASFSRRVSSSSLLRFRVVVSVDRRRSARDRDREKGTRLSPTPSRTSERVNPAECCSFHHSASVTFLRRPNARPCAGGTSGVDAPRRSNNTSGSGSSGES